MTRIGRGNPNEIFRSSPRDKFQFPYYIDKIAKIPITNLQKLPLQDEPMDKYIGEG